MKEKKENISMEIVNPNAAGIDIGSRSHWVAVGQAENDVREFGVYNDDLKSISSWLKECHKCKVWRWNPPALTGKHSTQY